MSDAHETAPDTTTPAGAAFGASSTPPSRRLGDLALKGASDRREPGVSGQPPGETPEEPRPDSVSTPAAETAMIETWELTKRYGDFTALSDCSVSIEAGQVFGLLGPNGAGKTTLLRLLLGFLQPTSGRCRVAGIDPVADGVSARRQLAYLPGDARLPRHMTGRGVLRFFADLHPDGDWTRSLAVAERLDLDLRRRVAFMSTGMRQKLALSVVFGPRTRLLILDEPTANLDPTVRAEVLELVGEAQSEGRTVVLSSHVLSEIEQTCCRVAFLRRGKLAHQLVMADLFQRHRISGVIAGVKEIVVPSRWSDRVRVRRLSKDPQAEKQKVQIDTAGDLAPLLTWINDLSLSQLRIEPLGLRAVYDAVHFGQQVAV